MATPMSVTWSVTGQREDFGIGTNGQPQAGYIVSFTTGRGNNGSVFVARGEYNPDRVRALVQAAAAAMDSVTLLTS